MDLFRPRWVSIEETQRLQQRIEELEAENLRLKNNHELIKEITDFFLNRRFNSTNAQQSGEAGTLEQVFELVKDLANDLKKIFKN